MILTLLAGVGLSHLIVDGSIFKGIRGKLIKKYQKPNDEVHWLIELITCYQCTGFWAGALMALMLQPINWGFDWYWCLPLWLFVTPFIFGCAVSYLSMAGASLLNFFDAPAMSIRNDKKA